MELPFFRSGMRLALTHQPRVIAAAVIVLSVMTVGGAPKSPYTARNKAFFADPGVVNFVRPGLEITINSANIAADGTITVVYTITDPMGLPLDIAGVSTPGAVSLSFIAATIPKDQEQYVAYTTRLQTGAVLGTVTQAAAESNGTRTQLADGQYQYVFKTKAPSGFDAAATHAIGIYGSRNLTEFNFGTSFASKTFNFVPNGSAVTVTRDVIATATCDKCHDQLSFHGGSRRGMDLCVLCHTPQTSDPDTGNTVDLKVMAHKIHMGSQLPSVQAGTPYQIIGFMNNVTDWSTVVHPADPRRCESCHEQTTGAAQATAYLTRPTRASCGACHDDVHFASGEKHAGGPQFNDNLCATCHIPQGEYDFDASIKGAHVVPTESSLLAGVATKILNVSDGTAASHPTVTFTVQDYSGNNLPLSQLGFIQLTLAGPTSDYGATGFGGSGTPGYVSESAANATCGSDGTCSYTFHVAIPSNATGSYSIGLEARRTETLLPDTTKEISVNLGAQNQVVTFSVDGSPVQPRKTVVATSNCNGCHVSLSAHGGLRNQVEMCVLCHNPQNTDASQRPSAQVEDDQTQPNQGINFNLLVHRIHDGVNMQADKRSFVVVGFRGSHNDFTDVRYPAMSPEGEPHDLRNCSMCHVNGSEQALPFGLQPVTDPQGPINPIQPIASACTGCHTSLAAASHALVNTSSLGESCDVCHSSGAAYSVSQVHAQY